MKIAHVVSTFYPRPGGMGAVVYDEAAELARRGHEVAVFTMRYPGDALHEEHNGFTIERLKPLVRLGDGGIVRWGNRFDSFDIIHLHLPWYGSAWLAYTTIKKFSKPYVVTLHMQGQLVGLKKFFKMLGERLWLQNILQNARKVFLVNKNYFKTHAYLKNIPAQKLTELFNPIDTNLFKPGECDKSVFGAWGKGEGPVILFVGNLLPLKRLDFLLTALLEGPADWRLAVVGGGYSEAKYKQMAARLGLGERVKFFGAMPRERLPEFYSAADCTVVPSESESFSLVAIESLACGTPTIVRSMTGAVDREGDGAFTFRYDNVSDLINILQAVLSGPKEAGEKLQEVLSQAARRKYGIKKHVDMLEQVYKG